MDDISIFDPDDERMADSAAWRAAAKLGYAVPMSAGETISEGARIQRCRARTDAALSAIGDIQQWLVDDNPDVRDSARLGMSRLMYTAYVGDQNENAMSRPDALVGVDKVMYQFLTRKADIDASGPWWEDTKNQRRLRKAFIWLAFAFAAAAGVLFAFRAPAPGVPLVVCAGVTDLLDGAFARAVHMRDARLRWRSCIASHAGDMTMLAGIAVGQDAVGGSGMVLAPWIAFAIVLSLFGSFTRTSALQAGYRMWRSPTERWVRYGSITCFAAAAALGHAGVGVAVLVTALVLFAGWELGRVTLAVERMPHVFGSGVVFAFGPETVQAWGLSDGWEGSWEADRGLAQLSDRTSAGSHSGRER